MTRKQGAANGLDHRSPRRRAGSDAAKPGSGAKPDPAHTVVVVSDLHCGSTKGLIPPAWTTLEGQPIEQNAFQRYLWGGWMAFCYSVQLIPKGYTLVVNGDAIEGLHHRSTEVWSLDPGDHAHAAYTCLMMLAERAGNVYVVRGTECHTGPSSEHGLAIKLGAEKDTENNVAAFDRLDLTINGTRARFVHHMPTSTRMGLYATGLSVMLAEHQVQAARKGVEVPRVVVMSHRHTYGLYEDGDGMAVSTPCWQGLTRFGHKVATAAEGNVGGLVMTFDEPGALPVVRARLYKRGKHGQ